MNRLFLIVFLCLFLLPVSLPASAQHNYEDYRALIGQIDMGVEKILLSRNANHRAQQSINQWTKDAGAWIDQQSNVNTQLIQAKNRAGNFATMTEGQLSSEIETLNDELANILKPPGGRLVGGQRYHHLEDIYAEMPIKSKELTRLQEDDYDLIQELNALDAQRDKYARAAEQASGMVVEENSKILNFLKDLRETRAIELNDPNIWCEQHYILTDELFTAGPIVCRDRKMAIIDLTVRFRNEMIRTGKPYDEQYIANLIKSTRDESIETKKFMREELIPELDKAIQHAEKVNRKAANPTVELAGCWLILHPGGRNHAMLSVSKDIYGNYTGKIVDYGWIGLSNGHVLFDLKRTNATTFDGMEHSIINKRQTETPLRIIVDRKRQSAGYRTRDDTLTLKPCD